MKLESEEIFQSGLRYTKELQITLDDDFNVPDSKPDIESVVKDWGNVYIDSVKVNDTSADVKGNLDFALLYSGKSSVPGEITPVKMTGGINFSETINLSEDGKQGNVSCVASIEDLTIKSINSRKISVRAIVTLTMSCFGEEWKSFGCNVDAVPEDNVQVKEKKLSYTEMCVNLKDNLRVRQSLSLPQGKPNIGELLWEDLSVRNLNSRMTDEGLVITGDLTAFVMYQPDTEGQKVQWYEGGSAFEEKLDVSGASQDVISFVKYHTVSCNVEPKANYDGEMRDLNMEMVLELDVRGFLDKEKNILEDVYCPSRKVALNSEDVELSRLVIRNNSRCKVASRINVNDGSMLQIINCTGDAHIDYINVEDDGIMVEGVLIANVMYVTSIDSSPIRSVQETIPFSHKITMNVGTETHNSLEISLESISAVMTGSGEAEIKGTLSIDTICFEKQKVKAITDCQYEDFNQEEYLSFPEIVCYIANGKDSLWTVARDNHTTVDIIRQENKKLPEHCDYDYVVPAKEKLLILKAPVVAGD